MGSKHFTIGVLTALVITCLSAHALDWETDHIAIKATPDQESAEAVFPFTNSSEKPVTVKSVRSSCGCTVPELEKRVYQPGESGEIKALFKFGTRTGEQRKTITVLTDETDAERVDLRLAVSIPELIKVKPFFVFWRKGDTPETRKIELRVFDPDQIMPVSVKPNDDRFDAVLEPTEDPAVFMVAITPRSTQTSGNSHFLITTNFPAENPRVIRVYAGIR